MSKKRTPYLMVSLVGENVFLKGEDGYLPQENRLEER